MHRFLEDRRHDTGDCRWPLPAALYIAWKITQSPDQALQFAFNGLAVGAVYALIATGYTLVYSTVWFFDLYYGALPPHWALTAYFICVPSIHLAGAMRSTSQL